MWYDSRKCPKPEFHISSTLEGILILVGLLVSCGLGYGGFYIFRIYRQRENYAEQLNTDGDDDGTPPIYS